MRIKLEQSEDLTEAPELYVPDNTSATTLVNTLVDTIQQEFGCDLDDLSLDTDKYPERLKGRFVVYNVSDKVAYKIKATVKEYLTANDYDCWRSDSVECYHDGSYITDFVDSAYVVAFNVDKEE